MHRSKTLVVASALVISGLGCGSASDPSQGDGASSTSSAEDPLRRHHRWNGGSDAGTTPTSVVDSGTAPPPAVDSGTTPPSGGSVTAADLLALTTSCTVASKSRYATDSGGASTVDICSLPGAFFWKADMDVDCDGKRTAACSESTDPWFQPQTSFTDSTGAYLDASTLPYVVIPLPSTRFSYTSANIRPGAVVAVIYGGKVVYGVFGDEGPSDIIGEASYAMAASLGIDSNPKTGGIDSGVTYIVFTGAAAVPTRIEDHAEATALGQSLAAKLVGK
ncbi:MAG: glycoside hydrolase family 75 protein [Polyangiales bacterium]